MRSFAASALGPVVTSLFQVITVPLYLRSWGTNLYGDWLIVSAVPAYLTLTDFGFASVAANTMTMDVARKKRDEALSTFQCAWALTVAVGIVVAALVGLMACLPLKGLLHLSSMSPAQVKIIFVLQCVRVLIGLQSNLNQAGFRCDGNYAVGMLCVNSTRLAEVIFVSIAVFARATPITVSLLMVIVWIAGVIYARLKLRKLSNWIKFSFEHATFAKTRELLMPALAYMAFPIGDAISIQGMTLAVGLFLGPGEVVIFATLRTLTRLVIQAIRIIMYSMAPEISMAWGAGDWRETQRLHRISCQLSLWTSTVISLLLALTGDALLKIWTHNRVPMVHSVYWMLLGVVVANSLWHGSSALLLASNLHSKAATIYVVVTTLSLGAAIPLMKILGLGGAAAALLLIDILYGSYVVVYSLSLLKEPFWSWVRAILHFPGNLPRHAQVLE